MREWKKVKDRIGGPKLRNRMLKYGFEFRGRSLGSGPLDCSDLEGCGYFKHVPTVVTFSLGTY